VIGEQAVYNAVSQNLVVVVVVVVVVKYYYYYYLKYAE